MWPCSVSMATNGLRPETKALSGHALLPTCNMSTSTKFEPTKPAPPVTKMRRCTEMTQGLVTDCMIWISRDACSVNRPASRVSQPEGKSSAQQMALGRRHSSEQLKQLSLLFQRLWFVHTSSHARLLVKRTPSIASHRFPHRFPHPGRL
jgi:hypothetical protein